jgi:CRP-like cAMP-binding protein
MNKRISDLATGTSAANATPDAGMFRRVAKLFGGGGGRSWAWGVDKKGELAKSPLFQGVSDAALGELAAKMSAAKFSNGHFICTQGEYGRELYLLVSGLVEVLVALDEGKVEKLAQVDAGEKDANTPAGSALRTALIRGLTDQLAYANGQLAMLDFEKKRKTGSFMTKLLRAKASTEAPQRREVEPTYEDGQEG